MTQHERRITNRDRDTAKLLSLLPPPVSGHRDCISREQAQAVVLGQLGYHDVLDLRDRAWQQLGAQA